MTSRMAMALVAVVILTTGCSKQKSLSDLVGPQWTGWVYPTGDLLVSVKLGKFDTLEECRSSALDIGGRFSRLNGRKFDYECGKSCQLGDGSMGLYICDETVK